MPRRTTRSTFDIPAPQDEPETRAFFLLKNEANIQIAYSIFRTLGIRFMEDEEGQRVRFSFYSDIDRHVAFRNIRRNIDRKKEGRGWK